MVLEGYRSGKMVNRLAAKLAAAKKRVNSSRAGQNVNLIEES
jgi:hypothetical protein